MAMQEITGTAGNIWALLAEIRGAATANGYTENQFVAGDPGIGTLRLQRNGKFYNIYANNQRPTGSGSSPDLGAALEFSLSTGYVDDPDIGSQPNEQSTFYTNIPNQAYVAHHFFIDDDPASQEALFACNLEFQPGYFRSFFFGDCRKQGSYTGGELIGSVVISQSSAYIDDPDSIQRAVFFPGYFFSLEPKFPYMRVVENGGEFWRFGLGGTSGQHAFANIAADSPAGVFWDDVMSAPNPWNQRALTRPIRLFTLDTTTGGSGRLRPRGYLPTVHIMNMQNHLPGDIVENDYKVFPVCRQQDPELRDDTESSGNYGIAFKFQ